MTDVSPIVFDLETAGLPEAAQYLEPIEPDRRLKDPEKIAADILSKEQAREDRLGLDWNVGRIVCLGWWTEKDGLTVNACETPLEEEGILRLFWQTAKHRTLVGFRCKDFDLKFAIQRSRYLKVPYPQLDLGRYSKSGIVDLYHELTFNDSQDRDFCMRRTLHAFCRRFGIPVADSSRGSDISGLVALGKWDEVIAHCSSDVQLTVALAQRLGFVREREVAGVL